MRLLGSILLTIGLAIGCTEQQSWNPTSPVPIFAITTNDYVAQIQTTCWRIQIEWHFDSGWSLVAKADTGGISSVTIWIENCESLDDVLRQALDQIDGK